MVSDLVSPWMNKGNNKSSKRLRMIFLLPCICEGGYDASPLTVGVMRGLALFDYETEEEHELSLKEGDIVEIKETVRCWVSFVSLVVL
jgi:hypothetical protein